MQTSLILSEPFNSCVYQRDKNGFAFIPVAGSGAVGLDTIIATFTPVNGGQKTTQSIAVDKSGNFAGTVGVTGGWYSLVVNGKSVNAANINRVGSGEVFIKFGHSYMDGGHDQINQKPANDPRVITLLDTMDKRAYEFGPLTQRIGPFNTVPDAWGVFGDNLVKRIGVPVLIYGVAYGGSSLKMTYELLAGKQRSSLPPGTTEPASRMPYAPLETVLEQYIPRTGLRAVLVEHGYNDRGTSRQDFTEQIKYVFTAIRERYKMPNLAFVLAQEQLTAVAGSLYDIPTAQAQTDVINAFPDVWKGVDFNSSYWLSAFGQHDHLYGLMIDQYGTDWADSLTNQFFVDSTPYGPSLETEVLPVVLYAAPGTIKTFDWVLLILTAFVLMLIFIKRSKYLVIGFLLLGLLALGRVTNKI